MAKKDSKMVVFFVDTNSAKYKKLFAAAQQKDSIDRNSAYRGARIPLALS